MPDIVLHRVPDAIRMSLDRAMVLVETLEPGLSLRRADGYFDVIDANGQALAQFPTDWLRAVDPDLVKSRVLELLDDRPGDERSEVLSAAVGGDFELYDMPFDGEVAVRIGGHTYVIERELCLP